MPGVTIVSLVVLDAYQSGDLFRGQHSHNCYSMPLLGTTYSDISDSSLYSTIMLKSSRSTPGE